MALVQMPDVHARISEWINERDATGWRRAIDVLAAPVNELTVVLALMQLRAAVMLHYKTITESDREGILCQLRELGQRFAGSRKVLHDAGTMHALMVHADWQTYDTIDGVNAWAEKKAKQLLEVSNSTPLCFYTDLVVEFSRHQCGTSCYNADGETFVRNGHWTTTLFRRHMLLSLAQMAIQRIQSQCSKDAMELLTSTVLYDIDGAMRDETVRFNCPFRDGWNDAKCAEDDDCLGGAALYVALMRSPTVEAMRVLVAIASCRLENDRDNTVRRYLKDCMCQALSLPDALHSVEFHHEMCRLIFALFQHAAYIAMDVDVLRLVHAFSLASIAAWRWAPHSLFYLMGAWASASASMTLQFQKEVNMADLVVAYVRARMDGGPHEDDALALDGRFEEEIRFVITIVRNDEPGQAVAVLADLQPASERQWTWTALLWSEMLRATSMSLSKRGSILRRTFELMKAPLQPIATSPVMQSAWIDLASSIHTVCLRFGGFDFGMVEEHFASATQLRLLLFTKASALMQTIDSKRPELATRMIELATTLIGSEIDAIVHTDAAAMQRMLLLRDNVFASNDGNKALYNARIAFYNHLSTISTREQFVYLLNAMEQRIAGCKADAVATQIGILVDLTGMLLKPGNSTSTHKYVAAFGLALRHLKDKSRFSQIDVFLRRGKMLTHLVRTMVSTSTKIDVFLLIHLAVDCIGDCHAMLNKCGDANDRMRLLMLRLANAVLMCLLNPNFSLLLNALQNFDGRVIHRLTFLLMVLPDMHYSVLSQPKAIAVYYSVLQNCLALDKRESMSVMNDGGTFHLLDVIAEGIECTDAMQEKHGIRHICMGMLEKIARRTLKNNDVGTRHRLMPLQHVLLRRFMKEPATRSLIQDEVPSRMNMGALYVLLRLNPLTNPASLAASTDELHFKWLKDMSSYVSCGCTHKVMMRDFRLDSSDPLTWHFVQPPDLSTALTALTI